MPVSSDSLFMGVKTRLQEAATNPAGHSFLDLRFCPPLPRLRERGSGGLGEGGGAGGSPGGAGDAGGGGGLGGGLTGGAGRMGGGGAILGQTGDGGGGCRLTIATAALTTGTDWTGTPSSADATLTSLMAAPTLPLTVVAVEAGPHWSRWRGLRPPRKAGSADQATAAIKRALYWNLHHGVTVLAVGLHYPLVWEQVSYESSRDQSLPATFSSFPLWYVLIF